MVSDQHRQLTTLAGWRRFAGEVPAVPELLAEEVWAGLQDDKRLAYDEDRLESSLPAPGHPDRRDP